MSNNFHSFDQVCTNYAIDGVNYGRKVRILAQTDSKFLIWIPGQSYHADRITGSLYAPSRLYVHCRDRGTALKKLSEGGRLSTKLLKELGQAIDSYFGEGFWQLLDPKKTVIVGEPVIEVHH